MCIRSFPLVIEKEVQDHIITEGNSLHALKRDYKKKKDKKKKKEFYLSQVYLEFMLVPV